MLYVLPVLSLLLLFGALVDLITRDDSRVNHLPKLTWVFIIVLLPLVGSILWFAVGRDWGSRGETVSFGDPRRQDAAVERLTGRPAHEIEAERRLAEKEARLRRLEAELEARRRAREGE